MRRRSPVDDKAPTTGKRQEGGRERRVRYPVVCPGRAPAQRQYCAVVERDLLVEPRAEFAARVARRVGVVREPKAAAGDIGFAIAGDVEALRLQGRIGRKSDHRRRETVAALEAPADAVRVEVGRELVAGDGNTVGRYPVRRIGERTGEISRARSRQAVDAGLESIALAAAEPVRQAPVSAGATEREADLGVGRKPVVETCGDAPGVRAHVMTSHHGGIASRVVGAAIGRAPDAPWLAGPVSYTHLT